jgi:hypothetical protein
MGRTTINVSAKELKRYDILQRLIHRKINGTEAASLLNMSVRNVRRLKAAVRKRGITGLRHNNAGRPGNRRLPDRERQMIIRIIRCRYADFHPTFAAEKLREIHGIHRHVATIRRLMIAEGLWQSRRKKKEEHRQWRARRSHVGELVQFDGSYERWFEDRAPKSCLLLAVDDATGGIAHARFAADEGVFPVFAFWREYVEKYGKPMSIYLDKFSTYKMTQQVALDNHDLKTQFQRAMQELGIEVIFAHSPQAKGRVENKFKTLQDRLIKELRLSRICNREDANAFLDRRFIADFNRRFAKPPRSDEHLHRPLTAKELGTLPRIFSRQTERTVQNDWTISFQNQWYQLAKAQSVTVRKRDTIIVEEQPDGTIRFRLRGKYLNAKPIPKRPQKGQSSPWILPATYR